MNSVGKCIGLFGLLGFVVGGCDSDDSNVGETDAVMSGTSESGDEGPGEAATASGTGDDEQTTQTSGEGPGGATGADGEETGAEPTCGNGEVDGEEVCDGEAGVDATCASLGYVTGTIACAADCMSLDESGCSETSVCGDGEVTEGEACEPGVTPAASCGDIGEGSGDQACLDCAWNVSTCCSAQCTDGCDNACGADPADLTGHWSILFFNNGWQGPDPTMELDLVQDGTMLSGSFTTDAWYLGDHEFDGAERSGNDVYMHVPITQLSGGMIMEGTVCGGCRMQGVTDPQGGLNSDWIATRVP